MIKLTKSNRYSTDLSATKVFEGIIHINNKGIKNMSSEISQPEQQLSIEDVMSKVGFEEKAIKKAIAIKYELNHFLKTEEDRINLVQQVREKQLYPWMRMFPFKVLEISKQIGTHHYTYNNFSHLEQMDIKDALQCLFLEPFNQSMMDLFYQTKLTLAQIFELRLKNPNSLFRILTLSYA
ncbi:hypothetical protein [Paenibacillus sp. FSL E2-0178]|uniref:hypothetical protein n=1 Tax=Paenibacillus sp. FSL E2-0178 TaxID=2921361 RepID=UPI00315913C3